MKTLQIKLRSQFVHSPLSDLKNPQHTDHVRSGLAGDDAVSTGGTLRPAGSIPNIFFNELCGLIERPAKAVYAGVDDESSSAQCFVLQAAQVSVGVVVVPAEFIGQTLCI